MSMAKLEQLRCWVCLRILIRRIDRNRLPSRAVPPSLDRKRSWLTTQACDVVWLRGDLETIKAVSLYRVHPVNQNDRLVTSAAAWLAGE